MKFIFALLLFALPILFAAEASACVCDSSYTIEKEFSEVEAVFTARYIGSEYRKGLKDELVDIALENRDDRPEYEVMVHKFVVSRWWKGSGDAEVVLISDRARLNDGTEMMSDCDLGYETWKAYLVYAYKVENGLKSGACSRTKSLTRAAGDLKILKKLTRK